MTSSLNINMVKEDIKFDFGLKNMDEGRNYLLEEVSHYNSMIEKLKKVCRDLNWFKRFHIFVFDVSACISIFALYLLVDDSIGIANSAVILKISATTAGIKKYRSIMKKKSRKHNSVVSKD